MKKFDYELIISKINFVTNKLNKNMFNPNPSAIGIAPLNSTIGNIDTKNTIKYLTKIEFTILISFYFTIQNNCIMI